MSEIIKETDRPMGYMDYYEGVCDGCVTPLKYQGRLVVIEVAKDDECTYLCPKDRLVCPNCNLEIVILKIYQNMDVSAEFKKAGLDASS